MPLSSSSHIKRGREEDIFFPITCIYECETDYSLYFCILLLNMYRIVFQLLMNNINLEGLSPQSPAMRHTALHGVTLPWILPLAPMGLLMTRWGRGGDRWLAMTYWSVCKSLPVVVGEAQFRVMELQQKRLTAFFIPCHYGLLRNDNVI